MKYENSLVFRLPRQVFTVNITSSGDIAELSHPILEGKYENSFKSICNGCCDDLRTFKHNANQEGYCTSTKGNDKEYLIKDGVELELVFDKSNTCFTNTLEQINFLIVELIKERECILKRTVDNSLKIVKEFPAYSTRGDND